MDPALGPLDLVKYSAQKEKPPVPLMDTNGVGKNLEELLQKAADLINSDIKEEFLYRNPYKSQEQGRRHILKAKEKKNAVKTMNIHLDSEYDSGNSCSKSLSFVESSSSINTKENEHPIRWSQIAHFEFPCVVRQINEFIQTWEMTAATRFVVIAQDKVESVQPFGERFFVEAHFSKPTPKCPNPLAVAKVYFYINVSQHLPSDYPINVTYQFEGYKTLYYVMGARKLSSNKFQQYLIDSILHMKLAFFAELCECRNPLKSMKKRKKE